jgi:translation initiation factor eIF-2B subunit delta
VHPCFLRLGLKHSEGTISGSTARATSLLEAFKEFIKDFTPNVNKQFSVDLLAAISPLISFVAQCRQLSDSMGSAIKHLKKEISELPPDLPTDACKELLIKSIDKFIRERIVLAQQVRCASACLCASWLGSAHCGHNLLSRLFY